VKIPIANVKSTCRARWRRMDDTSLMLETDALKG